MKPRKIPLAEVTGFLRRGISPRYVDSDGIVVLNQKCVRNNRLDFGPSRFSDQNLKVPEEKFLQAGDVLVNSTGEGTLGRTALFRGAENPVIVDSHITIVRPRSSIDAAFLAYYLASIEPMIESLARGATNQTELSSSSLAELEIPCLPLSTQRKISEMLSAYDDLIENNRRRMELLEESARLLYREWFVRLRFPGHEHARLTNGAPQGWERKLLNELTSFLKRGIAPHYNDDAEGLVINQKCIRDGRLNMNLARRQNREFAPERQVQFGDVLVNSTGEGTLGRIAQVKAPVENCTVDTHVTIVRPKLGIPIHYFGMVVMAWESQFSTMGRGATNQTELSPGQIGESPVLLPKKTLMEEFESFAEPVYQQVTNLVSQNDKLRAARDLLLPRLMSGEIAV
jgi:type I restriction enzyme S subunit